MILFKVRFKSVSNNWNFSTLRRNVKVSGV